MSDQIPPSQSINKPKRFGKRLTHGLFLLVVIVALSYEAMAIDSSNHKPASSGQTTSSSSISTSKSSTTPQVNTATKSTAVNNIFVIVMENQPLSNILGSSSAPYINSLISSSALATNYSGVAHPSLPNYIALTSGSADGITTDCNPPGAGCVVSVSNIADEIEASGRTWKNYAESMPSACYKYNYGSLFATKHVPFLYYSDIYNNSTRCASHIVPYSELSSDLNSVSTTPNFAFITPNLCDDMHSCPITSGDSWLSTNVPMILKSPAFSSQKSLLAITWDEGYSSDNIIATIFAGSAAKSGYRSNVAYSHYSLLHTIENLWNLKPLTANDQNATLMSDMLK